MASVLSGLGYDTEPVVVNPMPSRPCPPTQYYIGAEEWAGLTKVIEESGELGQVMGKLQGNLGGIHHFDGSNLEEKFVEEIGDLYAALRFFVRQNLEHRLEHIEERAAYKHKLFVKWHNEELQKGKST